MQDLAGVHDAVRVERVLDRAHQFELDRRGPVDDEWNQPLPPPKLASDALVRAVVAALRDGIEDVYPGDVAQEWLARWRENPKAGTVEIPGRGGTNSMCDLSFVGKHTRHF